MKILDVASRTSRGEETCAVTTEISRVLANLNSQDGKPSRAEVSLPEPRVELGKLGLDTSCCRAFWNGKEVSLTMGEYSIVHLLVSPPGKYMTYRALYDRLRGKGFIAGYGADGYRGNVSSVIKRIRKKFCACDAAFDQIENYSGFGYCWRKPD